MRQSPTKRRVAMATSSAGVHKKPSSVSMVTEPTDTKQAHVVVDRPMTAGLGMVLLFFSRLDTFTVVFFDAYVNFKPVCLQSL